MTGGMIEDASSRVLDERNVGFCGEHSLRGTGGGRVRMAQPGASCARIGAGWRNGGEVGASPQAAENHLTLESLQSDRPDQRRVRHRQGTGRPRVAYARPGARWTVRHVQLFQPGRVAGRIAVVRSCARSVHRRPRRFDGIFSLGQRRHAVSRRDWRVAAAAPAQAAAGGRDPRSSAGRLVA